MLNENEKKLDSRCTTYCLPGIRHVTLNFWTGEECPLLDSPTDLEMTKGHPDFEDGTWVKIVEIERAEAPPREGHPAFLLTFEPVVGS